jgi:hypothetical protein
MKMKNNNIKHIGIKFDLTQKEERELYNVLFNIQKRERIKFLLEIYKNKTIEIKEEMTIYEKRLFDIMEIAVQQPKQYSTIPVISTPLKKQESSSKKLENIKSIEKDDVLLVAKDNNNEVDYDKIVDDYADEGFDNKTKEE